MQMAECRFLVDANEKATVAYEGTTSMLDYM